MSEPKLSELLSKLGYRESDELFSVYNEVEYNQLFSAALALEADNKEADRLLLAAAFKYTGLEARLSKRD